MTARSRKQVRTGRSDMGQIGNKEIREKRFSQRMGYGTRKILLAGDKLYWKRGQLSLTLACLFSIYTTLFRAFLTASRSAHMLLSWLSSSVVSDHHLCPFSGCFSIHHRSLTATSSCNLCFLSPSRGFFLHATESGPSCSRQLSSMQTHRLERGD